MSRVNNYDISREIKTHGLFFADLKTSQGVAGELTYLHNRDIFIHLTEPIQITKNQTLYFKNDRYNCYTLYNVKNEGESEIKSSMDNKLFSAEFLIGSTKFPKNNLFRSISFETVNLMKWFPTFRYTAVNQKRKKQINIPHLPSITVNGPENTIIKFECKLSDEWTVYGVKVEMKCKIIVVKPESVNIQDLFESAIKYRTLFKILTGHYSSITNLLIEEKAEKYRMYFVDEKSESDLEWGHSHENFLSYRFLYRKLDKTIRNWDRIYKEINQVIEILTAEYSSYGLSAEVRFLNVARALETFHRKLKIKNGKKEKDIIQLVANLIEKTPKKHKEFVKQKLSYIHEPTLRSRVTELYENLNEDTKRELQFDSNWIKLFTDSRNYYTHFDKKGKNVLHGQELLDLSNKIRVFLHVLIILELGIDEKKLTNEIHNLVLI